MKRSRIALVLPMLGLGLTACPREPEIPAIGGSAESCSVTADCNDDECGLLRTCVDGYCEEGTSLVIPCD